MFAVLFEDSICAWCSEFMSAFITCCSICYHIINTFNNVIKLLAVSLPSSLIHLFVHTSFSCQKACFIFASFLDCFYWTELFFSHLCGSHLMVFVCRIFKFSLRISVFQKCLIQHFKKLNWPTFCHIKTKNVYEAHFCWDFIQSNALCEIETKTFIVVQIQKWTLMVYLSVATFSSWSFPPFFVT